MNVLDSPLEALAFNYVSFGFFTFVSNLWTWIAVVTAAVSFWRIRAAGDASRCLTASSSSLPPPRDDIRSSNRPAPPCTVEEQPTSSPTPANAPAPAPAKNVEEIGVTKGLKFVLVYDDVNGELTEELEESDGELTATGYSDGAEAVIQEWWGSWERVLRTRMGKAGWYRYQDLTELNGNVVRLWDGNCRDRDTFSCGPKRCVLW